MLFNGLMSWLAQHRFVDRAFLDAHTRGGARALLVADNTAGDAGAVARTMRARPRDTSEFYEWFASTERVVTLFSQGVNQSSVRDRQGQQHHQCASAHGSNRPARHGTVFHYRPAERDGRARGGWACHHARRAYGTGECRASPHRAEFLGCAADRGAARPQSGGPVRGHASRTDQGGLDHRLRIRSSVLPNADRAREALRRCELVVVSDCVAQTDTTALAHVLLPAAAWGEKEGTVTNSERHISRQRGFLPTARHGTTGLVDDLPGRATNGLSRRIQLFERRRDLR